MAIVSATMRYIMDESKAVAEMRNGYFMRFLDDRGDWIDVEIRDGRLTVRGLRGLSISPVVVNEVTVELRNGNA